MKRPPIEPPGEGDDPTEACVCDFCRDVRARIERVKARRPAPAWDDELRPYKQGDQFLYGNQMFEITEITEKERET